jgi:hypothetical protein
VGDSHLYLLTAGKERFTSPLCFLSFFIQDLWFSHKTDEKAVAFLWTQNYSFLSKERG